MTWTPLPEDQIPDEEAILAQFAPEAGDPEEGFITAADMTEAVNAILSRLHYLEANGKQLALETAEQAVQIADHEQRLDVHDSELNTLSAASQVHDSRLDALAASVQLQDARLVAHDQRLDEHEIRLDAIEAPVMEAINPTTAPYGTEITLTITGQKLNAAGYVIRFWTKDYTPVVVSPTEANTGPVLIDSTNDFNNVNGGYPVSLADDSGASLPGQSIQFQVTAV